MTTLLRILRFSSFNSNIFDHICKNWGWRCYSSSSLSSLIQRGIISDVFPENWNAEITQKMNSPQTVYAGFDPTSDSLHTGNLLVIMSLLHCQRAGHRPLALLGGATGLIGDPSGKQTDRPQLSTSVVENNLSAIRNNLTTIFQNHQAYLYKSDRTLTDLLIVNNADWYKDKNVLEYLSEVGRHFRISQMINRHSVRSRLESESGLSLTEFCYQTFQANDWLHLYRHYNCRVQIGGSDQIGNIAAGYELVKKITNKSLYGLILPLLTTTDGRKLGKTDGNALWLDSNKTTAFQFYQGFINCTDADVETQLRLFTFLNKSEIVNLMARHNSESHLRKAQKKLAEQVTLLVHGESGLKSALKCTKVLYGGSTEALHELTAEEVTSLFVSWPKTCLDWEPGTTVLDAVLNAKFFDWEGDVDRIIKEGGLYINLSRCNNPETVLVHGQHILYSGYTLIRIGKKKFHLIEWRS